MKSKKSYPGFSFLFSIGKYRKWLLKIDDYELKISFLFFTITFVSKDLNNLLESYVDTLLTRIKELEQNGQN